MSASLPVWQWVGSRSTKAMDLYHHPHGVFEGSVIIPIELCDVRLDFLPPLGRVGSSFGLSWLDIGVDRLR